MASGPGYPPPAWAGARRPRDRQTRPAARIHAQTTRRTRSHKRTGPRSRSAAGRRFSGSPAWPSAPAPAEPRRRAGCFLVNDDPAFGHARRGPDRLVHARNPAGGGVRIVAGNRPPRLQVGKDPVAQLGRHLRVQDPLVAVEAHSPPRSRCSLPTVLTSHPDGHAIRATRRCWARMRRLRTRSPPTGSWRDPGRSRYGMRARAATASSPAEPTKIGRQAPSEAHRNGAIVASTSSVGAVQPPVTSFSAPNRNGAVAAIA